MRDSTYRVYLDFLETAEKKRRWNIFDDIPWKKLDSAKASATTAQCVEIFCSEELYLPDYASKGIQMQRLNFGHAWFQTCWAFEETRHGLVFREYLTRSGQRSETEFAALEERIFSSSWQLPYETPRRMACYGALQEGATYAAYKIQKDKAHDLGDEVLEAIFHLVGRDEAAHAGFYRAMIGLELCRDREGTIGDIAHVLATFKMPGDGLIDNYRERLRTSGAGISPRVFLERVLMPLLATLDISRRELKLAMKKQIAIPRTELACEPPASP
ncbi:MAG TPA: acyl-ACP desaturase [Candidatus Binataceae bacterium]|nr:acyl-ACP desaturase [Candidatus Binataceae bacterium]